MAVKKNQKKESQYTVISSYDYHIFINEINKLLRENYELVGGVSTVVCPNQHYKILYSQALVLNI
jgi:hypothetical protein